MVIDSPVNNTPFLDKPRLIKLPDGQRSEIFYDALGRTIETRDALGYATRLEYNSLNKVIRTEEPQGKTSRHYYNVFGDETGALLEGGDSGIQRWVRGYTEQAQLAYEMNTAGQTWTYSYDLRGLPLEIRDPRGTRISTTYSPTGLPLERGFSLGGEVQSQSWSYDEAGALKGGSDGSIQTLINQASGGYRADPYDLVTSYETRVAGRSLAWASTYDQGRRPTLLRYPDGSAVSFEYNDLGQLVAIPGYAKNGLYNFMGRLASLEAANGTGRTKSWNATSGNLDAYQWSGTGKEARSLDWDKRGNITGLGKDGYSASYLYDGLNRLQYAQEGWPVEAASSSQAGDRFGARERDVAGRKPLAFGPEALAPLRFDYHASSVGVDLGATRRINKARLEATGPRISPRTVEAYVSASGAEGDWSRVEGISLVKDQRGTTILFAEAVEGRYLKLHSLWDERDADNLALDHSQVQGRPEELLEVWSTVEGQTTSYTYDALGNRLSESRHRGSSSQVDSSYYPNSNRLKTRGEWKFAYDPNGNLIARGQEASWSDSLSAFAWSETSGEFWQYEYDLKNRLVSVKHGEAGIQSLNLVASYAYDMRDLRVSATRAGETSYYQYDLTGNLIYSEEGEERRAYIQALGETWAEVRSEGTVSATYYHHSDHLGTTELITDEAGKIVWSGSYEPFGTLSLSNGSLEFRAKYTGKELDEDTGLYYFNARWYDAELGRFMSEDPARDGENWFSYVGNRPLTLTDPTGLEGSFPDTRYESSVFALAQIRSNPAMQGAPPATRVPQNYLRPDIPSGPCLFRVLLAATEEKTGTNLTLGQIGSIADTAYSEGAIGASDEFYKVVDPVRVMKTALSELGYDDATVTMGNTGNSSGKADFTIRWIASKGHFQLGNPDGDLLWEPYEYNNSANAYNGDASSLRDIKISIQRGE